MQIEYIGRNDLLMFMANGNGSFFAILDPVAWEKLPDALSLYDPEYLLLYKGNSTESLMRVLPRVVRLEAEHGFTAQVLAGYSNGWGILVQTLPGVGAVDIVDEQSVLAYAKLPEGELAWLRYYDPYVAKTLLSSFRKDQLSLFFGKHVHSFIVENPENGDWIRFIRPEELPVSTRKPVMLSPDQLEKLSEAHYEMIAFELTQYCLETFFPGIQGHGREAMETVVRGAMEVASSYGFTSIDATRRFVELGAQFGWDFHLSPEASAVLSKAYSVAELRLEALERCMLPTECSTGASGLNPRLLQRPAIR